MKMDPTTACAAARTLLMAAKGDSVRKIVATREGTTGVLSTGKAVSAPLPVSSVAVLAGLVLDLVPTVKRRGLVASVAAGQTAGHYVWRRR